MTEHRSKNTLGSSAPVKTMTEVEDDGTSEDGSPRPVCTRFYSTLSRVESFFQDRLGTGILSDTG